MASRSDIKAGRAYVELYLKNSALMKGLKGVRDIMGQFGTQMQLFGAQTMRVGAAIATTFGAAAASFALPVKLAGDLMETQSKFAAVFGESTAAMTEWAETYAATVGRAKSDTQASLATMQSFFLGMGLDAGKASEFAKQMAAASVDFASFHNLSDEESMQRFISALSGSGEVLSMFGVNIMQAALDQQLLSMGFKKSTQGATEMEKVLARIAIIQRTMSKQGATNDAITTAGSFSNQLKKLAGEAKNAGEAIGTALLPLLAPLVTKAAAAAKVIAEWVAKNEGLVVVALKVSAGLAAAGAAIFAAGGLIYGFGVALHTASVLLGGLAFGIAALLTPMGATLAAIVALQAGLVAGIAYWVRYTESGKAALEYLMSLAQPLVDTFTAAFGGIRDALQAGDLASAANIGMTAVQIVFERVKLAILGTWLDMRDRLAGAWDTLVVETSAAMAFVGSLVNQTMSAIIGMDFFSVMTAGWAGFKAAAVGAFQYVLAYANGLIAAMNSVSVLIGQTIKQVAVVMPAIAAVAKTEIKLGTGVDIGAILGKAGQAAQDTREQVGEDRNLLRNQREFAGDVAREDQQAKIAAMEADLQRQIDEAKEALNKAQAVRKDLPDFAGMDGGKAGVAEAKSKIFGTMSAAALQGQNFAGPRKKVEELGEKQLAQQAKFEKAQAMRDEEMINAIKDQNFVFGRR